jgi:hypothetical protein
MDMEKQTKGYIALSRRTLLYLHEQVMDFADYGFYLSLVQIADWDNTHKTYGFVRKSDVELAKMLQCNPSTIGRRKHKLLNAGVISYEKDSPMIKIINFEKFMARIALKLSKQTVANLQDDFAQTQKVIAELQKTELNSENPFNVSSNVYVDVDEADEGIKRMREEQSLQNLHYKKDD